MTAEAMHLVPPATRQRRPWKWVLLTFGCLGLHLALIWTLEEPLSKITQRPNSETEVHWITDSWALERLASLPGMHDPAVFALPALEGFSGSAWLTFKPLQLEFTDEAVDNHWLELTETSLGEVLQSYFTTNVPQATQISDLALPSLLGSIPQTAEELATGASSVQVDNSLAARLLTPITNLPSWTSPEVLTNSVVQVLVDGEGRCLSSTLLTGCGAKAADAFAVKWALACRFRPERRSGLRGGVGDAVTSGRLIFRWRTEPVGSPGTPNQVATKP